MADIRSAAGEGSEPPVPNQDQPAHELANLIAQSSAQSDAKGKGFWRRRRRKSATAPDPTPTPAPEPASPPPPSTPNTPDSTTTQALKPPSETSPADAPATSTDPSSSGAPSTDDPATSPPAEFGAQSSDESGTAPSDKSSTSPSGDESGVSSAGDRGESSGGESGTASAAKPARAKRPTEATNARTDARTVGVVYEPDESPDGLPLEYANIIVGLPKKPNNSTDSAREVDQPAEPSDEPATPADSAREVDQPAEPSDEPATPADSAAVVNTVETPNGDRPETTEAAEVGSDAAGAEPAGAAESDAAEAESPAAAAETHVQGAGSQTVRADGTAADAAVGTAAESTAEESAADGQEASEPDGSADTERAPAEPAAGDAPSEPAAESASAGAKDESSSADAATESAEAPATAGQQDAEASGPKGKARGSKGKKTAPAEEQGPEATAKPQDEPAVATAQDAGSADGASEEPAAAQEQAPPASGADQNADESAQDADGHRGSDAARSGADSSAGDQDAGEHGQAESDTADQAGDTQEPDAGKDASEDADAAKDASEDADAAQDASGDADATEGEIVDAEAGEGGPADAQAAEGAHVAAEAANGASGGAEAGEGGSAGAEAAEGESIDSQSADAEVAEAESTDGESAGAEPVDGAPAGAGAAEAEAGERESAGGGGAEGEAAEGESAEAGVADGVSAEAGEGGAGDGGDEVVEELTAEQLAERLAAEQAAMALITALMKLRGALAAAQLPLEVVGADEARQQQKAMLDQLDDYLLPRLVQLEAPILTVVGGSTGAGKSTLVNTVIGKVVSEPGVLRPTTRSPVLIHHPADADWFVGDRVLPDMARTSSDSPGGTEDAGQLRLVAADTVPRGLAILDAPDIDSVVEANRDLATQLLAAADLWLFVTTAARYSDAVPWEFLESASDRSTAVAVVLDRAPGETIDDITGHLAQLLLERGLGDSPLFSIQETVVDGNGMLPPETVASIKDWLIDLAADAEARAAVVRRTLQGAVSAMVKKTPPFAAAVRSQAETAIELRSTAETAYDQGVKDIAKAAQDGTLLRGEVLARWQEFVGTGELLKGLQSNAGRLGDRLKTSIGNKPAETRDVSDAIESGLESLLREHAVAAAERAEKAWQATAAGRQLLAAGGPELGAVSEDFEAAARRVVRHWQTHVLDLVRTEGADKRSTARILEYGVNGLGLSLMVVIFASGAGIPKAADTSAGAGSAVVGQKLLEAVFGDAAVRSMVERAREDLDGKVHALMDAEFARFLAVLDQHQVDPDTARQLTEAARAVEDCT